MQQSIPDIKISFIKIDVEGAELEVMESLSYT
ncbi:MAG: FkbM family methyltransferase [Bacteroidetes bacterium]|nr:FkbM family methyltransferase [Bacteroidota bacterium]